MRILFLSPYVPFPVRNGGHNRTASLIRGLSRLGPVHVMAIGDSGESHAEARRRFAEWNVTFEVHPATGPGAPERDAFDLDRLPDAASHFRSPSLEAAIQAHVKRTPPDVVHIEELVMARYAGLVPGPRLIDRQKSEWRMLEALAEAGGPEADHHRREAERFRRWEARVAPLITGALVPGVADLEWAGAHLPADAVHVVPIVVDEGLTPGGVKVGDVRYVLLYGSLDYAPNVEGTRLYFEQIWPRLSAARQELETRVVGSGQPPRGLIPENDRRVRFEGYVPDVASVLRGSGVLVVPLRIGGGVRTKVLEAMACGMPVVSTAVGAEGLGAIAGRHYLAAETPEEIAAAVLTLAADPARAACLGREGSRLVDASFRQPTVDDLVASLYRPRPPAPRDARSTVLLVGVWPPPEAGDCRHLSFPGHRTAHFRRALQSAGHEVECVWLDEEGAEAPAGGGILVDSAAFRAGRVLQQRHDAIRPQAVVAAGGYHAARAVSALVTDRPRFIDLAGDLAAEGQLRSLRGGTANEHLAVLRQALAIGDRFSVVSESQRLAVLGQLGLLARLGAAGDEPVDVIPVAADGPETAPPLPDGDVRVLWAGGYNTWMDEETLLAGVEAAMDQVDSLTFVSTGGEVPGHEATAHGRFWQRARTSRHAARFLDHGRLPRSRALEVLTGSHVVVSVSRPCLEAELGSRQRVVEGAAHGRAIVMTDLGDVARAVTAAGAGIAVPASDARALAEALVGLAGDRSHLVACGAAARRLWEGRWTPAGATARLVRWTSAPASSPPLAEDPLAAEVLRLESELSTVRSSLTFRALRLLDRALGRGRPR